ncbi:MAG: Exocyst complex component 6, partial [Paramarteilia canceri]
SMKKEFAEIYKPQRRQQLRLCSMWLLEKLSVENISIYFKKIIGFFIIEDTVLQNMKGVIDTDFILSMWIDACKMIKMTIKALIENFDSVEVLFTIKTDLFISLRLAKQLNLSTKPLETLLDGLK